MPTFNWYYSPKLNELYHYTKGVFECHAPTNHAECEYSSTHSLKVVADDAVEAAVTRNENQYIHMRNYDLERPIEWVRITEKEEIERRLIERNKRHLQQMAMEKTPPSLEYFSDL